MSVSVRGRAFSFLVLAASACLAFALAAAPARADDPAAAFVQTNVQKGLVILNNKSLSQDQMRSQFRDFLTSLTDIKRIALFTLGSARRTAPDADVNAFVDAFRDYAVAVYEARLGQYSGQTLKVTGSSEVKPGDWIVTTQLVDPNAKPGDQPIEVKFRVDQDGNRLAVIDVSVVGVWLAIEERAQFTAFLGQNGNDIHKLIDHLNALTDALKNGGGKQPM